MPLVMPIERCRPKFGLPTDALNLSRDLFRGAQFGLDLVELLLEADTGPVGAFEKP